MPAPQASVQQRQDLSSFLLGNIAQMKSNRDRAASDAFGNVLAATKTAFDMGTAVDKNLTADNDRRAAGMAEGLNGAGVNPRTGAFDPDYLRAQMLVNPDLQKQAEQLKHYQTTGQFDEAVGNVASLDDTLSHLFSTGELTTDYTKIKGTSAEKTDDFFATLDPKWADNPVLSSYRKRYGDTINASQKALLLDIRPDKLNDNVKAYLTELVRGGEVTEGVQGAQGQSEVEGEQGQAVEGTATATPGSTTIGTAPQGPNPNNPRNVQSSDGAIPLQQGAAAGALGNLERSRTSQTAIAPNYRYNQLDGLHPALTTEKVRSLVGSPSMQAAYNSVPGALQTVLGIPPEKVAGLQGITEGVLAGSPAEINSAAARIKNALPEMFKGVNDPKQIVQGWLTNRSNLASSILGNAVANGGVGPNGEVKNPQAFTVPVGADGRPVLYRPGSATQGTTEEAPTTPAEEPNLIAKVGDGKTTVGYSKPTTPTETGYNKTFDATQLGADTTTLTNAYMKQSTGQALTPEEKSAVNGNRRIGAVNVRINGDAPVGGLKLSDYIKTAPTELDKVAKNLMLLKGMGISDEALADPNNTSLKPFEAMLTANGKRLLEQNDTAKNTLAGIIDWNQAVAQSRNSETGVYNAQTNRMDTNSNIAYRNGMLQVAIQNAAVDDGTAGTPNSNRVKALYITAMKATADLSSKIAAATKGMNPDQIKQWAGSDAGKQMFAALAQSNEATSQLKAEAFPVEAIIEGTPENILFRQAYGIKLPSVSGVLDRWGANTNAAPSTSAAAPSDTSKSNAILNQLRGSPLVK